MSILTREQIDRTIDAWVEYDEPGLEGLVITARAYHDLRERVLALCDELESSPTRGVLFGGAPMPAIVTTDAVRRAIEEAGE